MPFWKHLLYVGIAGGMLLYAIPRLAVGEGLGAGPVFGTVWLCFALLVIAAQLHELMGVDAAKRERLRQVKRMRKLKLQQKTDSLAQRFGKGA